MHTLPFLLLLLEHVLLGPPLYHYMALYTRFHLTFTSADVTLEVSTRMR